MSDFLNIKYWRLGRDRKFHIPPIPFLRIISRPVTDCSYTIFEILRWKEQALQDWSKCEPKCNYSDRHCESECERVPVIRIIRAFDGGSNSLKQAFSGVVIASRHYIYLESLVSKSEMSVVVTG